MPVSDSRLVRPAPSASVTENLKRFFAADSDDNVVAAWLFGSEARRTARINSDVDVAVLLRIVPPRTLAGLPTDLTEALARTCGERRVDVVVADTACADLVHRVLRDGVLLLDREQSARVRFEVKKRSEYFGLKPFLDRYRAAPSP